MEKIDYLTLLRFIHITTGVFWAGATIYLAWFVLPAVKAAGPAGGKFMQQLAQTNKLPVVMTLSSIINVISGGLLLWELSGGFQSGWLLSKHGLVLLTGSLLALLAFIEGFVITRPNAIRMNELSLRIAGNPPTEEQQKQLLQYRKKISAATNLAAYLLLASVVAMSLVRYW